MSNPTNGATFETVMRLCDEVAQADTSMSERDFDRLADAKFDAIEAVLDHGTENDKFRVLALLAAEGHDVEQRARRLLSL
jgi:hypothetical protein